MLALVEGGRTRASWMAVPAGQPSGYTVVAERGGGTRIDGGRVESSRDLRRESRAAPSTRE